MANKASDHLHQLIQSLSKPEKRYFKVFTSRHVIGDQNNYQRLFDAIDKQDEYKEEAILKKFEGEAFVKRFSIAKSRLYQSILKSLDAYHSNSSIEAQLKRQIHCAEILYHKSLYQQSAKLLHSAKKVAVKHEKVTSLIEIRRWEKRLVEQGNYEGVDKKGLKSILKADQELAQRAALYDELWNAKSRVFKNLYSKGKVRSKKEQAKFKKIIDDLAMESKVLPQMAENQYLLNHTYSAYHYGIGDHQSCYEYLLKNLNLIQEKPYLFSEEPNVFFSVLTNVINVATKLGKTDDAFKYLAELRSLPKNDEINSKVDLELRVFSISNSTELALYAQSARYEEGLSLIPTIEEGLLMYEDKLSSVRKASFYFNIAVLLFGAGKPNEALKWINQLLNNIEIDLTQDIHCMAQLFNLVLHLELGNKSLLPYTLRSTQRYLQTREKVYQFENVFLKFVNELLKVRKDKSDQELFSQLREELTELNKDPFEQTVNEYFNFEVWARAFVEGKPFQQVQLEWMEEQKPA